MGSNPIWGSDFSEFPVGSIVTPFISFNMKKKLSYILRSNKELLFSFMSKKRSGDRAFSMAKPTLWNKQPSNIRHKTDTLKFKKDLETCLFTEAYS